MVSLVTALAATPARAEAGAAASQPRPAELPPLRLASSSQPVGGAGHLHYPLWSTPLRRLDLELRGAGAERPRLLRVRPFVAMASYQVTLAVAGWAINGNWPIGWKRPNLPWWKHNVTSVPEWNDGDQWWLNWGGHAIFGSDHYLMARNSGWSWYTSVLFATFGSFFWEYVTEGVFEVPSAIDLVTTPILGSLLGEARYRLFRAVRRRWGERWYGYVLMTLLDPTTMFFEKLWGWR